MKFRLGFTLVTVGALLTAGCGDDDDNGQDPPTTGAIGVSTTTTGVDLDDSYEIYVGATIYGTIGANDQVVIPDQAPAGYAVGLSDVAANCTVTGSNPVDGVAVVAGQTTAVPFEIVCAAANTPPTADAGPDQTVVDADDNGGEDVTLDGTGSTDGDGTITNYSWTEGGTEIANGSMPTATFAVGVHTVTLTVTDDGGATDTDIVTITVEAFVGNQPPVADAGPDQTVTDADGSGDEAVTLDGTASADADGTIASYSWAEGGTEIATGATPTVTFAVGAHTVTLTVTDDEGATDTDDVVITVNSPTVFFSTDILPYFASGSPACTQCHSGGTGSGGVNLDTYAGVTGTNNGGEPLVVPGDSSDPTAILLPQVQADHFNGPDDAAFATTLATWIDEGALDN